MATNWYEIGFKSGVKHADATFGEDWGPRWTPGLDRNTSEAEWMLGYQAGRSSMIVNGKLTSREAEQIQKALDKLDKILPTAAPVEGMTDEELDRIETEVSKFDDTLANNRDDSIDFSISYLLDHLVDLWKLIDEIKRLRNAKL